MIVRLYKKGDKILYTGDGYDSLPGFIKEDGCGRETKTWLILLKGDKYCRRCDISQIEPYVPPRKEDRK